MTRATDNLLARPDGIGSNLTRELANSVMGRADVIPLWFGEPEQPTPEFICNAAIKSLQQGQTYYAPGLGCGFLREAIAEYLSNLHPTTVAASRIAVTVSGGNAINLAFQSLLSSDDVVVTHSPTFPNLVAIPALQGAQVCKVPMDWSDGQWNWDLEKVFQAAAQAKIVLVNSPNNPTAWVMSAEQQRSLLKFCRERGIWIISDEVYGRLTFDRDVAPSFLDICEPEDRVIVVNSFSKAWAMTGWRLGWMAVPDSLLTTIEKIMEFSVSCAPEFAQRAAVAALQHGESFIRECNESYVRNWQAVRLAFEEVGNLRFAEPRATFYGFFQVPGVRDNLGYARQMIEQAGVGLAPGTTFDAAANDWYRLCFAQSPDRLADALQRLIPYLQSAPR